MKLSAELIAKLEPLTRNPAAFIALRDVVDAMVAEKSEKHIAAVVRSPVAANHQKYNCFNGE